VIFPPATTGVYRTGPWRLWISSCLGDSSDRFCLKSSSCTLARAFASGFLQIPPRGRHPCLWLMVGARQPPFRTFTVEMTPMLGVPKQSPKAEAFGLSRGSRNAVSGFPCSLSLSASLVVRGVDSEWHVQRAPVRQGGGQGHQPEEADPPPAALQDQDQGQ